MTHKITIKETVHELTTEEMKSLYYELKEAVTETIMVSHEGTCDCPECNPSNRFYNN